MATLLHDLAYVVVYLLACWVIIAMVFGDNG